MSIAPRFPIRCVAVVAFVALCACGSKSTPGGPTPTANPPKISCPTDVTVSSVPTLTQPVTYTAPTVTDGTAPVTVTCSPESGATFARGTTAVSCQATDAMQRQAACSFNVTLKGFSIAAKKYDAIGDSFTEGQNGEPGFIDTPNAYPTKLQAKLQSIYPGQGISVLSHGEGGARIDVILGNLLKFVTADKPDAVLVEGGYNDLLGDCGDGPTNTLVCRESIQSRVPLGIRDCIRRSKEAPRNVPYVFAMTLTPPGPASTSRRISSDAIVQTNARIRTVVAAEGGILVDVYPLFIGHEAEYIDTDSLHLRPAGNQALADAFFAAIQKNVTQTPLFGFRAPR